MAKKQSNSESPTAQEKKKPGAGAVFGSIVFFILTFLSACLLIFSTTLHLTLQDQRISHAISRTDFSEISLTQDGKTQSLSAWIYEWYFSGAPNVNETYIDALISQDEYKIIFTDYFDALGSYLLQETDTLPTLSAESLADVMQYDLANTLAQETGITFTDEDRDYFLWATDEDIPEWNHTIQDVVGQGFGKAMIRLFATLPGIILAAGITLVFFILWLIFSIKGHWRKGRMLTGYGVAIAIPSLLILLSGGILLLLVNALHLIDSLSFAKHALPLLLLPAIWSSLGTALIGIIFTSIGIFTNSLAKAHSAKNQNQETTLEMSAVHESIPTVQPEPAPEPTTKPVLETEPKSKAESATVLESPESEAKTEAKTEPKTASGVCPHCGTQNSPDSKFCGACGGVL